MRNRENNSEGVQNSDATQSTEFTQALERVSQGSIIALEELIDHAGASALFHSWQEIMFEFLEYKADKQDLQPQDCTKLWMLNQFFTNVFISEGN